MSSYLGKHASLYDTFYAEKLYSEEAAFIDRCFKEYGNRDNQKLLELACGTGEHAFALEKLGYDILATDYSESMLEVARQKAARVNSRICFEKQDMREIDLEGTQFDAVYSLFDSIGYVQTNDSVVKVLKNVYRHLKPEGLIIFEFWHAGAMLRSYDPLRVRRWKTANGEILRISETMLDQAKQTASVTYSIYELKNEGAFSCFTETQTNRYFLLQEMSYFLESSGFEPLKWFDGFTEKETITENTWHIVAVARKKMQ